MGLVHRVRTEEVQGGVNSEWCTYCGEGDSCKHVVTDDLQKGNDQRDASTTDEAESDCMTQKEVSKLLENATHKLHSTAGEQSVTPEKEYSQIT